MVYLYLEVHCLLFACLVDTVQWRTVVFGVMCCDKAVFLSLSSVFCLASDRGCLGQGLLVVLSSPCSEGDRCEAERWLHDTSAPLSRRLQFEGWHKHSDCLGTWNCLYDLQASASVQYLNAFFNASLGSIILYVNSRYRCEYWYGAVSCKSGWVPHRVSRQVCPTHFDACAVASSLLLNTLCLSADTVVASPITWKEKWCVNCCWYSTSGTKGLSHAAVTGKTVTSAW